MTSAHIPGESFVSPGMPFRQGRRVPPLPEGQPKLIGVLHQEQGVSGMTDMEKLLAALAEVRDDVDFAGKDALVDDGLIDSFDLTQIIAALDEAFDIHIITGDIEPENFNNVQSMLELVHRYQGK